MDNNNNSFTLSSNYVGLIDYNFDCLKKAISEIYHEKGLELQRKRELVI
jgi:hypothetical protein